MAEIEIAASGKKPGVRRVKKLSTKVDLTPMVDLGFLLITFFIFSTTMSEPARTDLFMPKDSTDSTKVKMTTALTVFPVGDRKIIYYHGKLEDAMKSGEYGVTNYAYGGGIGDIIRKKKIALDRMKPNYSEDLFLIIKPTEDANYQEVIDVLDEATINVLNHYAITDITQGEKEFITKMKGSF